VCERVVSSKSCILIGSGSRQNFISDHGHGNRTKTIEWKLKNNLPPVDFGNFFYLWLKDATFWQLTILTCVVNGNPNKEGNSRPCNTLKRRVLFSILCSLAWQFVSLLLNSLYTAVLVFKLQSPLCLLTPIFTLIVFGFHFLSSFIDVRYIFIQEIVQALTWILLFHLP